MVIGPLEFVAGRGDNFADGRVSSRSDDFIDGGFCYGCGIQLQLTMVQFTKTLFAGRVTE